MHDNKLGFAYSEDGDDSEEDLFDDDEDDYDIEIDLEHLHTLKKVQQHIKFELGKKHKAFDNWVDEQQA